ncbi:MAG: TonB-dependent receptor [Chitinophagaceae bacterium]|nr:MAG: TonB-dependent receptor [Chitinophagaceae bacterium]
MLFFCISIAYGQTNSITGKVKTEEGSFLANANVYLLKISDSTVVDKTVTSNGGSFTIKNSAVGNYVISIQSVGFTNYKSYTFELTGSTAKDFAEIIIKKETKTLSDVEIQAKRPRITQKEDRMIVDVEGSVLAAGNSAFHVLSQAPGVIVDHEGSISLNGKSGVTVMLNGRLTHLSARDLKTMLEGMTAENVKNIEIITNPSAKFDAEGSSGILNINLKKNTKLGTNGSVAAGHIYNGQQSGYTTNVTVNNLTGKFNSYINADVGRRVSGRDATFTRIFYAPGKTTYFDQLATGNNSSHVPALRLGTDYSLAKMHSIGANLNYFFQKGKSDFLTNTNLGLSPNVPAQNIVANNYSRSRFSSRSYNLNYLGKLDTNGTTLSADFDYVKVKSSSTADFLNYYTELAGMGSRTQEFLYTEVPSEFDVYSAKMDFSHDFSKNSHLDAGGKFSYVFSDNDSRFFFNNNNVKLVDPSRTNPFLYTEKIYAGYVNWKGRLSKKTTYQAGLRLEGTNSVGELITTSQLNDRNYANLFPSLFISHQVSANYQLNFSYSRRISRPNYRNLNPFIFYRDPYTYELGNPDLQPQTTNSISITQIIKKTYSVLLQYQQVIRAIREIPILDIEKATTIYTTGNLKHSHNYNFQLNAPAKILKSWDTNNFMFIEYNDFLGINATGETLRNKKLLFGLQSVQSMDLPYKIKFQLTGVFLGPRASGLYTAAASGWIDIGAKRSFLKDKLDLNANLGDILKTYRLKFSTEIGNNVNDFDQYFRNRILNVTLRYRFSNGQKVQTKNAKDVEEVKRI